MPRTNAGKRCLALLLSAMLAAALLFPAPAMASDAATEEPLSSVESVPDPIPAAEGMEAQTRYLIVGGIALGACTGLYLLLNLRTRKK